MDKTLEPSDGNEMTCERCKELEAKLKYWHQQHTDAVDRAQRAESERDALQEKWQTWDAADLEREIDTLCASNAALREAAHFLLDRLEEFEINDDADDMAREFLGHVQPAHERLSITLADTPADSLTEYRNGVLEEAAKEAEDVFERSYREQFEADGHSIAKAIRAMKTSEDT